MPLNESVCVSNNIYNQSELSGLSDAQKSLCYPRTGLVYQCPLVGETNCGAIIGNGDALSADGTLFDRVGKSTELLIGMELCP